MVCWTNTTLECATFKRIRQQIKGEHHIAMLITGKAECHSLVQFRTKEVTLISKWRRLDFQFLLRGARCQSLHGGTSEAERVSKIKVWMAEK